MWNKLNSKYYDIPDLKPYLKEVNNPKKIKFYSYGHKLGNIFHLQIRLGRSNLNAHRFQIGLSDTTACACGAKSEDNKHFILKCPNYGNQRVHMLDGIKALFPNKFARMSQPAIIHLLLHGLPEDDTHETIHKNKIIAKLFQTFILSSKRLCN